MGTAKQKTVRSYKHAYRDERGQFSGFERPWPDTGGGIGVMDMSTTEQQARQAQEEMKRSAKEAASEAKSVAEETKSAAEEGYQELKHERKPMKAAMKAAETATKPVYLGLAAGSIALSLILYGFRKKEDALFIGQWAPTFLALGLFSKLIGESGSQES